MDLIKKWRRRADKCNANGRNAQNSYTAERLFAEAVAYRLCADELERATKDEDVKDAVSDCPNGCTEHETCRINNMARSDNPYHTI